MVKVMMPGDKGYEKLKTNRMGKPDVVSPELDPLLEELLKSDATSMQFTEGDPFTEAQFRYWAQRLPEKGIVPEDKHVRISCSKDQGLVEVSIHDKTPARAKAETKGKSTAKPAAKKAAAKKAPAKKAAAKRTSSKPVAKKRPAKKKAAK